MHNIFTRVYPADEGEAMVWHQHPWHIPQNPIKTHIRPQPNLAPLHQCPSAPSAPPLGLLKRQLPPPPPTLSCTASVLPILFTFPPSPSLQPFDLAQVRSCVQQLLVQQQADTLYNRELQRVGAAALACIRLDICDISLTVGPWLLCDCCVAGRQVFPHALHRRGVCRLRVSDACDA